MSSEYHPGSTRMLSPLAAASIASWIFVKSPPPPRSTVQVAALASALWQSADRTAVTTQVDRSIRLNPGCSR